MRNLKVAATQFLIAAGFSLRNLMYRNLNVFCSGPPNRRTVCAMNRTATSCGRRPLNLIAGTLMLLCTLHFALCTLHSSLSQWTKGEAGSPVLKINSSAKSRALGGAFTAYSGGLDSLSSNPAGLSAVNSLSLNLGYLSYFLDTSVQDFSIGFPYKDKAFGFGLKYFSAKDMARDSSGNEQGEFDIKNNTYGFFYAWKTRSYSYGLLLNIIDSQLKDKADMTFSGNIGMQYKAPVQPVSFGISAENLGNAEEFDRYSSPKPMAFRIGGMYSPTLRLNLLLDSIVPVDSDLKVNMGAEYKMYEIFSVFCGYSMDGRLIEARNISAGFSLRLSSFRLDYSFTPNEFIGNLHHLALNFRGEKKLKIVKPVRVDMSFSEIYLPEKGPLEIIPKFSHEQIFKWTLEIKDAAGAVIRDMEGFGFTEKLSWDGRDADGKTAEPENYYLTLSVIDESNSRASITKRVHIPSAEAILGSSATALSAPEPLPEINLREVEKGPLVLQGIAFGVESAELTMNSYLILNKVADSLLEWTEIKVEISGHTDSTGSANFNNKLSAVRAEKVREYLVERGIEPERITAIGLGFSKPIADNNTEEGRSQNRRVEIRKIENSE